MRKLILAVSLLLSFSNFALAVTESSTHNVVTVLKKQSNWDLIQPGNSCIEHYQFSPTSNELIIKSNQQQITGTYGFVENEQLFELRQMVLNVVTDNKKPDCTGNSVNQANTSISHFLRMQSDQKIYLCLDALGQKCPVYLRPKY